MFTVYYIPYDTSFSANLKAVVAADSARIALSLLEEHVKQDPEINPRAIEFMRVIVNEASIKDSGVKADKPGVLYPFYDPQR